MSLLNTPNDFVNIPMTVDPNDLADAAVQALQTQWPDWVPSDDNLEVALIEIFASMFAQVAVIAANMPAAALIQFGTTLLGVPIGTGVSATTDATFEVTDDAGYDIPVGSELLLGGVAFQTTEDLEIPNGETTGTVEIAATNAGTYANGLTDTDWSSISLPVYVIGVTTSGATADGVDPQDYLSYLNTVAQELQLRSKSIITLLDFVIVSLNIPGVGRATATASGSHPRNITVTITDQNGDAPDETLSGNVLTAISDPNTRMVNANVSVDSANYTTVGCNIEVLALPNVDPVGLASSVQSRLAGELSPLGWGNPLSGNTPGLSWVNQPVVHVNRMLAVGSQVAGVDYPVSVTLFSNGTILGTALTTGGAITTMTVDATVCGDIPDGSTITITDPTGEHTQNWVTTADTALGATTVHVTSQVPNFAYPVGSLITAPVAGDLTMAGTAPLPLPGTINVTVDTPSDD